MARANIRGALITPLAALFYKDCLSAVQETLDELGTAGSADMWPVAVVNPNFPGWRDDLEVMVDQLGCVALRLFPNYHGYRLPEPQATALLEAIQDRQLPLIVSTRVEDERLHHWLVRVEPVSPHDITWVLRTFPAVQMVLCGLRAGEIDQLRGDILAHPNASVDTSERMPQFFLEEMVDGLGADRIVFGTGMPLEYPECALQQVTDACISENARHKILFDNAFQAFGVRPEAGPTRS